MEQLCILLRFFQSGYLKIRLHYFMVEPFYFAIGLWMPRTCPILLDVIALENSLKLLRSEFFTIVSNYLNGFFLCLDYIYILQDFNCCSCRTFFKELVASQGNVSRNSKSGWSQHDPRLGPAD